MVLTRQEAREVGRPRPPSCSWTCAANPEDPRSLPSGLLFLAPLPHSTPQARGIGGFFSPRCSHKQGRIVFFSPRRHRKDGVLASSLPPPPPPQLPVQSLLGFGGRGLERDGESEGLRWRLIVVNTVFTAQGQHGQFHWPVPPVRATKRRKTNRTRKNGL